MMIIIWSVVIALAFLAEFLAYNFVATWFGVGGLAALISAPTRIGWYWQLLIFFTVSFLFLLALRPFVKRFIDKRNKTVPTNLDANIGLRVKLLKDCIDGLSEIMLGDVPFKVICDDGLKTNQVVEIVGMKGNKYIVREETK